MEKRLTRSEEAAMKAYPNVEQPVWDESYPKTLFVRHTERNAFIKGYEQAEKDTIERAVAWLKDYVKYFELYDEKGVKEFKKAMEEE